MNTPAKRTSRLLIISPDAGGVTGEVQDRLRTQLSGYEIVDLDPKHDFRMRLTPRATVVVAGGDGSIGLVARALAGSQTRLGLLALGTYNNFARGLGIPEDVDKAIKIIEAGKTRPVTLGYINDKPFLEVGAIGMFGEAIAMGDKAKSLEFGGLAPHLRATIGAKSFKYTMTGDLCGRGSTRSLVVSNTPSTGAGLSIGRKDPREPFLELLVNVGTSRSDVVGRVLASAFLDKHESKEEMSFQFMSVTISTTPKMNVYADNEKAGRTPVTIVARPGAVRVIVP